MYNDLHFMFVSSPSRLNSLIIICTAFIYLLDYAWKNTLRYVRIYFDTPTFDRVTKDRAAKFVDMMSAIGGTMGLLTGFSIISGVEIIFFAIKILSNKIGKSRLWFLKCNCTFIFYQFIYVHMRLYHMLSISLI